MAWPHHHAATLSPTNDAVGPQKQNNGAREQGAACFVGYPTPHDFRRSCATGLAALGVPREDRLAVLAHAQDDVHAAHYDRYDRLAERRRALVLWEAHVAEIVAPTKTAGNVVKLSRGRRR
jgi:integrase